MENKKLIDLAKKAMKDAYSPYSSFSGWCCVIN